MFAASFTTKRVEEDIPVITVKSDNVAVEAVRAAGTVEALAVTFADQATGTKVAGRTARESTGRPELTEAAVVVSGGRGVGGLESFALIKSATPSAATSLPCG
ncbi:hypothetical protein GCM10010121_007210 [Streptomyces brasiliensis]|uniref:Uncharacterized protein n=1 Tax=Streptomyces brasiliensis TaxID=1954 RepID=A0A917K570_9ACTN|nr:hypothetical protein GCM10010121_007210 [Streptomyces brasiliensis]